MAFLVSAWIAAFVFVAGVTLTILVESQSIDVVGGLFGGLITFWFLFILVAILIVAEVYLWLGMMWFLLAYDRNPLVITLLWFVLVLGGGPYGAAVYHFVRYRPSLRRVWRPLGRPSGT